MLEDLLLEYKWALEEDSKPDIERALRDLYKVGVDKMTADILVEEV